MRVTRPVGPSVAVPVTALAALAIAALGGWWVGLVALGVVLIVGAVLRMTLPPERLGTFVVRSRTIDVLLLASVGMALIAVTASL